MRKIQKGQQSVSCHSDRISVVKDPVPQIKVLFSLLRTWKIFTAQFVFLFPRLNSTSWHRKLHPHPQPKFWGKVTQETGVGTGASRSHLWSHHSPAEALFDADYKSKMP